jgi:hypothetical protein
VIDEGLAVIAEDAPVALNDHGLAPFVAGLAPLIAQRFQPRVFLAQALFHAVLAFLFGEGAALFLNAALGFAEACGALRFAAACFLAELTPKRLFPCGGLGALIVQSAALFAKPSFSLDPSALFVLKLTQAGLIAAPLCFFLCLALGFGLLPELELFCAKPLLVGSFLRVASALFGPLLILILALPLCLCARPILIGLLLLRLAALLV